MPNKYFDAEMIKIHRHSLLNENREHEYRIFLETELDCNLEKLDKISYRESFPNIVARERERKRADKRLLGDYNPVLACVPLSAFRYFAADGTFHSLERDIQNSQKKPPLYY